MALPGCMTEHVPLAAFTTFRVGGAARYFAQPVDAGDVAEALHFAAQAALPVRVLGGGSNVLVPDAGVNAVVLRLSGAGEFGALAEESSGLWRVGAAVPLARLVAEGIRRGWSGLAAFAGIPGSVGGAAAMNAGGAAGGIGAFIPEAEVVAPDGTRRVALAEELGFSYRRSELGLGKPCGLGLSFRMRFPDAGDPALLEKSAREFLERKKATQPLGLPSAGCVFKNPPPPALPAGALLDAAGCKTMAEGGARVSSLHANFIVNAGGATASDILRLAERMRQRVLDASGILLDRELVVWGNA